MIAILHAIKTTPALQLGLLIGIISSISSGIMGSYVVIKRISSITGSISHSILGGIGFFTWLIYYYNTTWLNPMQGATLAAFICAFLIGWVHLKFKQKEDAIIATIWSTGMAIGIIFLSLVPGKEAHCTHFLFGDLFSITPKDVWGLSILAVVILFLTVIFYRHFLIICFDEQAAYLQKIAIKSLYFILLLMIGMSIVLLVQTIGIILVIALLTIPATIANLFTYKLPVMMIISIILAAVLNTSGIILSYILSWPPGATIALVATFFYIVFLIIKKIV